MIRPYLISASVLLLAAAPSFAARPNRSPAPLAIPTPRADMTVTDPIEIGYRLGYALRTPQYRVLALDQHIKQLREIPEGPDTTRAIARLDRIAGATRIVERRSLEEALGEMQALGAPETTQQEIRKAIAVFAAPLDTTPTAEAAKETDPAVVRILATLDEADGRLPKSYERIEIWLKLTRGVDALWGMRLGQLSAGLAAAQLSSAAVSPLGLVENLNKTRPQTAPLAVRKALDGLAGKMKKRAVDAQVIEDAAKLIDTAYPPLAM